MNVLVLAGFVVAGLLGVAVVLAVVRLVLGPSLLDRALATDVLVSALVFGAGTYLAVTRQTPVEPVVLVLAMVGFVGSVTIARFAARKDSEEDRR